jgi:hypothetical protein
MHILCTGAAGVIGRKLTAGLHRDGVLGGLAITVPEVRWYSGWPGHLLPISGTV